MNQEYLQFEGRILEKEGVFYLSYTNSSVSFRAMGSAVYMEFVTKHGSLTVEYQKKYLQVL